MSDTSVSSLTTDEDHIQVCVRIRPLLREEALASYEGLAWTWDKNVISQVSSNNNFRKSTMIGTLGRSYDDQGMNQLPTYQYDHLFKPEQSTEYIFDSVICSAAQKAMLGFHSSVFAYGQSGSGKTFTMQGTMNQPGIIPLTINYCFHAIQEYSDREFLFRVSYMEVYNEQIKDLLNTEPVPIKIQDGGTKIGTVLSGVKEQVVVNPEQILALMRAGDAQRHVGSTDMNDKSSRAHTLFKLIIESKERSSPATTTTVSTTNTTHNDTTTVRVSTLHLVDLAGSENAKMTNSMGDRAKEAKFINQSLLTLSTIIQRLSEESITQKKQHLPYRDSKLTRLMQSSLSGNANIVIICTISPTMKCAEESNNTLKFAQRAKKIKIDAQVNETQDDKTLLKAYRLEIEQLKLKLQQLESMNTTTTTTTTTSSSSNVNSTAVSHSNSNAMLNDMDVDIENRDFIIQMISEMEKLILKAEPTAPGSSSSGGGGGNNSPLMKQSSIQKLKLSSTSTSTTMNDSKNNKSSPRSPPSKSSTATTANSSTTTTSTTSATTSVSASAMKAKKPSGLKPPSIIKSMTSTTTSAASAAKSTTTTATSNGNNATSSPTSTSKISFGLFNHKKTTASSNTSTSSLMNESPERGLPTSDVDINNTNTNTTTTDSMMDKDSSTSVNRTDTEDQLFIGSEMEGIGANDVDDSQEITRLVVDETYDIPVVDNRRESLGGSRNNELLAGGGQVLNKVSKMLSMLKVHLTRTSAATPSGMNDPFSPFPSSSSSTHPSTASMNEILPPPSSPSNNRQSGKPSTILPLPPPSFGTSSISSISDATYVKQLENENKILKDEVQKKDKMLSILTEGLREVEINQQRWVEENQKLSEELDRSNDDNNLLLTHVQQLEETIAALLLKNQQLQHTISGSISTNNITDNATVSTKNEGQQQQQQQQKMPEESESDKIQQLLLLQEDYNENETNTTNNHNNNNNNNNNNSDDSIPIYDHIYEDRKDLNVNVLTGHRIIDSLEEKEEEVEVVEENTWATVYSSKYINMNTTSTSTSISDKMLSSEMSPSMKLTDISKTWRESTGSEEDEKEGVNNRYDDNGDASNTLEIQKESKNININNVSNLFKMNNINTLPHVDDDVTI